MSLISSLLKTKCLNSLTAAQFPPFSSEPFSLPTSTPSGLWGKLLMKGWKSHFFKEGKFFGKKIELKHILSLLIKYMPVLYFRQMQIILLLLCSAQKHARLAFITPGLYNADQGNQTWGTHCLISSMYFIFPFQKTGWNLRVQVIPLPSSLLGICHWCPGELPPAPGHPHQLIAVEGGLFPVLTLTALLQDLSLLKSIRVKKTRFLMGSEVGHSCWSLKTTEYFATEFLGNKNQVSLTEVVDRGPFALQGLSLELPRLGGCSSRPCAQTLWLQGVRGALPG